MFRSFLRQSSHAIGAFRKSNFHHLTFCLYHIIRVLCV
nr:MAG TPA: wound-inducible basic protein family protein [Caudoviricetes sp.]